MYTVTEQYIKPVTAAAGDVSWALMKHPQGLPCDVFITHAWSEGIFEFVDKVVPKLQGDVPLGAQLWWLRNFWMKKLGNRTFKCRWFWPVATGIN